MRLITTYLWLKNTTITRTKQTEQAVTCTTTNNDHEVIVKLHTMNAFNSVLRDHVLLTWLDRTPEIAKLSFLAYSKPLSVIASGHSITSSTGVQQGYPIGPLLFTLAVDQIASEEESEPNVWYLEDDQRLPWIGPQRCAEVHHWA